MVTLFSLVAKISSIILFIAIIVIHHWLLHQLDIKNTFLQREFKKEVYMDQSLGYTIPYNSRLGWWLYGSLYGLKYSPHAWFGHFSSTLIQFGVTRCKTHHFVFFLHSSLGRCIFLVVYVDDIVITEDGPIGVQWLKNQLFKKFQTKDLGPLRLLGIEVA